MQQDPRRTVRVLAELAPLPLAAEREPALSQALVQVRAAAEVLSAVDWGDAEPAASFSPPRPQR